MLWTAPECIGLELTEMTKENDVYSFGIIMSEIINRVAPYSTFVQYSARGMKDTEYCFQLTVFTNGGFY